MQEKNQYFVTMLHDAHLTQAQLAEIFGITRTAISRWHKIGVPQYAQAYLTLRAEYIELQKQHNKGCLKQPKTKSK